jgi:hypothetical protein
LNMSENLFAEFEIPSRQAWENAFRKELKDKSLEELIQTDEEGLRLSPISDASDVVTGFADVLSQRSAGWITVQDYDASLGSDELSRRLHLDLKQGLEAIQVWATSLDHFYSIRKAISGAQVHTLFLRRLKSSTTLSELDPETRIGYDPLALSAVGLTPAERLRQDLEPLAEICSTHQPVLLGHLWAEAGCNLVEQCVYALSSIRFLLTNQFLSTPTVGLTVGVGRRLIPEVAKLRALRLVWYRLQAQGSVPQGLELEIHARSLSWHLTPAFPHNNLIRLNLQGLAAVLGGTDSLSLLPYDWATAASGSDHARRMSLNLQHLMREESHLDRVVDPLGGSFVVERLTQEYVRLIEDGMDSIAENGDLLHQLADGQLRQQIAAANARQLERMENGMIKYVEVNHLRTRSAEAEPVSPRMPFFEPDAGSPGSLMIDPAELYRSLMSSREA